MGRFSREKWEANYATEDPHGAGGRWLLEERRIRNSYEAIPKGRVFDRVLDLASGEGHFTALLTRTSKQVTSVDFSSLAVSRAKARLAGKNVEFIVSDICDLEFQNGSFDLICAIEALFYCPDKATQILKWSQWLDPNGILIATGPILPDYFSWDEFIGLFAERFRKVTPVAVSSKMIVAKLANHRMLPFAPAVYDTAMKVTRMFPHQLAKHVAVVVSAADRIT